VLRKSGPSGSRFAAQSAKKQRSAISGQPSASDQHSAFGRQSVTISCQRSTIFCRCCFGKRLSADIVQQKPGAFGAAGFTWYKMHSQKHTLHGSSTIWSARALLVVYGLLYKFAEGDWRFRGWGIAIHPNHREMPIDQPEPEARRIANLLLFVP
jgi:hypothetical protein